MKFRYLFFNLTGLLFFILFAFPHVAFANTVTVTGVVKNSSGTVIPDAIVTINDATNSSTTTTSSGNYSLAITPGTYNIQVTPPGGSGFTSAIALNRNISTDTTLDFTLTPAGQIGLSGRVLDPLGNPVANQRVALNTSTGTNNFIVSAFTDSSGNYSLTTSAGTYFLMVLAPQNFNSLSLNIPQAYQIIVGNYSLTQSTVLDITIPAKKVDIHVQDAAGNPVSNVGINTSPQNLFGGSVNLGGITYSALLASYYPNFGNPIPTTDASGNVTVWLLPHNNYSFIATPFSGNNYAITTIPNIAITTDTQKTITIAEKVTLSGRLLDPFGNPIANQRVALNTSTSTNNPLVSSLTDSSGNYTLQAAPGTYFLMVLAPQSFNPLSLNVPQSYQIITNNNFVLTQNRNLDITVPAKKVDLHVQDAAGNPVGGVGITTSPQNLFGGSISLEGTTYSSLLASFYPNFGNPIPTTDEDRNVTLWLLPHNNYTFTATPPNGGSFAITTVPNIVVSNNIQKTITMQQRLTLSGRVLDPLGNPVANQRVALNTSQSINNPIASTVTDSSGNYSLTASAGTYYLMILSPQSFNPLSMNLPQSYQIITNNNFNLTQNRTLDITVPAKKVDIHVQDSSGNSVSNVGINTSPQNLFGGSVNLGGTTYPSLLASFYSNSGNPIPMTDVEGNVTLWLLPHSNYTFTATPQSGSIYSTFVLNNISVTGNKTELISLQYNHATPITTINLATLQSDGKYTDPTTVTLSATAASGYTVANTFYKVDGGAQQTYSGPFTVSGEGDHSIEYWSVDNSGVQEAHKTKEFTIYQNQAPVVDPLPDVTVNEGNAFSAAGTFSDPDSTSWTGTVDYDDGAGPQELELNGNSFNLNHTYALPDEYTVRVEIKDEHMNAGSTTFKVVVNAKPKVAPLTDVHINLQDTFIKSGSFTDDDSTSWTGTVDYDDGNGPQQLPLDGKTFRLEKTYQQAGEFDVVVRITDNQGAQGIGQLKVFVNAAPEIAGLTGATIVEGGRYTETGSFTDADSTSWVGTVNYGDGSGVQPLPLNPDNTFELDHIYKDNDSYTVTVTITDNQGAPGFELGPITVTNAAPSLGTITATINPIQVNTSTTANVQFTDVGILDTHTAVIDWGDGSTPTVCPPNTSGCSITSSNGSGSVSGTHTYQAAGVYEITIKVEDDDSGEDVEPFRYLSVYNPTNQSLFSGVRTFTSDPGDYPQNPLIGGQVQFGITTKYQGGMPTGKANMLLKDGNFELEFDSTVINVFVISNNFAMLKGTGTINKQGTYSFLVTGYDGGPGNGNDFIRFKITDPANNNSVVYDSQPGAAENANPTSPINGQVIVH